MDGKGKDQSVVAMIGEEREVITSDQPSFTGMGIGFLYGLPDHSLSLRAFCMAQLL